MIENSWKKTPAFIWHIKHWYLITGDYRNQSKVRNCDCLFTNLINFCSHQWSNINVWYVKYKLESSSMNFQWFWFTTKHFSLTNKDSRAQKRRKMVTICLPIQSITRSTRIKYQCLICQMKAGVFFNESSIILINNKTFFSSNKDSRAQKTEIVTIS